MIKHSLDFVESHGFELFAIGNTELLDKPMFSVSGSRQIDRASRNWLEYMVAELQGTGSSIVSGLALGSDTVAHRCALKLDIPTIAVLPCGFEHITPSSNKKLVDKIIDNGGLLLSEYFPEERASREKYLERNRIIAKLGDGGLIVPQFYLKSGTMNAVNHAKGYKKYIYIQNANYAGNQAIINDDSYKTIIK